MSVWFLLHQFPWPFVTSVFVFVFGSCIGSFLNVCIYRIPLDLSLSKPKRSFCPHCEKQIAWFDNIPLLSYLLLRGSCRHCKGHIRFRYFVVEAVTGVLFVLAWLKFCTMGDVAFLGLTAVYDGALVPIYWLVIGGLVLGTWVDFEHLIIPDRVTLGGIVAGLLLSLAVPALHNTESHWWSVGFSAIGALVGWGMLWGISVFGKLIFKKDAMGFGDVKLLGAIGAFFGWRAVLFNIMISSFAGSIIGIILVATKQRKMQSKIPYGPYIALAALVWLYWGPTLWQMYINLLAPPLPYAM